MPDELKNEITTYLAEVKTDLENYLAWANSEISMGSPDDHRLLPCHLL
jgi:hypothetical protein